MASPSRTRNEAAAVLTGTTPSSINGLDRLQTVVNQTASPDKPSGEGFFMPSFIERHEWQMSLPGPDGTFAWRDGPDGFYE